MHVSVSVDLVSCPPAGRTRSILRTAVVALVSATYACRHASFGVSHRFSFSRPRPHRGVREQRLAEIGERQRRELFGRRHWHRCRLWQRCGLERIGRCGGLRARLRKRHMRGQRQVPRRPLRPVRARQRNVLLRDHLPREGRRRDQLQRRLAVQDLARGDEVLQRDPRELTTRVADRGPFPGRFTGSSGTADNHGHDGFSGPSDDD